MDNIITAVIDGGLYGGLKLEEHRLKNNLANGGYVNMKREDHMELQLYICGYFAKHCEQPWFDCEAIQDRPGVKSWLERFFKLSKHIAGTYGEESHRRSKVLDALMEAHMTVKKILNGVLLSGERRVAKPRGSRQT